MKIDMIQNLKIQVRKIYNIVEYKEEEPYKYLKLVNLQTVKEETHADS
jgi:hypothetical protein